TSLGEFERTYGDRQQLNFSDAAGTDNYLWHAVRAFFEEGGKRVYISRVFRPTADDDDGRASATLPSAGGAGAITISARFPGEAGNMRVRFDLLVGQNALGADEFGNPRLAGIFDGDIVWMADTSSPIGSPLGTGQLFRASFNQETQAWIFRSSGSPGSELGLDQLNADGGDVIRTVTVSVTVIPNDPSTFPETWAALPVEPGHLQAGMPDSLSAKFAAHPNNLAQARSLPIVIELGSSVETGVDVLTAIFGLNATDFSNPDEPLFVEVSLTGGNDGARPAAGEYEGVEEPDKTGLKIFEDIEDISIVAAPGSTFGYENGYRADANTIINLLISHA